MPVLISSTSPSLPGGEAPSPRRLRHCRAAADARRASGAAAISTRPRSGRYSWARYYHSGLARFVSEDPLAFPDATHAYSYVRNNPLAFVDPFGLYTEIIVWDPVGRGKSAFGHVSTDINGDNFSFGPHQWDSTYPKAEDYIRRNLDFRGGTGYVLNLTAIQEATFRTCLMNATQPYHRTRNNCGHPPQKCMNDVGIDIGDPATLPVSLGQTLRGLKILKTTIRYQGPPVPATDPRFGF